jgi:hypothetical protein
MAAKRVQVLTIDTTTLFSTISLSIGLGVLRMRLIYPEFPPSASATQSLKSKSCLQGREKVA